MGHRACESRADPPPPVPPLPAPALPRTEADREDLFAEARALPRRVELAAPGAVPVGGAVVAGFHADGRASVYRGQGAADHLDPAGRLMRAFRTGPVGGGPDGAHRLYRTQGGTLAELVRRRTPGRTALVRRDLGGDELAAFLADARAALRRLAADLEGDRLEPLRTAGADCRADLAAFLKTCLPADGPLAPRYKGKR